MCSTWIASLDPKKGTVYSLIITFVVFTSLPNIERNTDISLIIHTETVHVPVWVVPGTISFPRQQGSHVIMVGPGTGCAPFRAYIEERVTQNTPGKHTYSLM